MGKGEHMLYVYYVVVENGVGNFVGEVTMTQKIDSYGLLKQLADRCMSQQSTQHVSANVPWVSFYKLLRTEQ